MDNKVNNFISVINLYIYKLVKGLGRGIPMSKNMRQIILQKYTMIKPYFQNNPKYGRAEKLVPLIIYIYCKFENIHFPKSVLFKVSSVTETELNNFSLQLHYYISNYI